MYLKKKLKKIFIFNYLYRHYIYPRLFQSEFDIQIIRNLNLRYSIDVGASSGLYTIELSKISDLCLSFEPILEEFTNLKKILKRNVILHNCALSNKNKKSFLNIPINSGKYEYPRASLQKSFFKQKKIKVTTKKFDTLEKKIMKSKKIDFIKIDVEGHENKVIKGMTETLKFNRPILLIEIERRHNKDYLWLFKFLKKFGYNCFYTDNGIILKKFKLRLLKKLQNPKNEIYDEKKKKIKKKFVRKYINNFWFIPPKKNGIKNLIF